jgi:hypothetical protein
MLVALVISQTGALRKFQRNSCWLDKIFSVLLFAIAIHFIREISQVSDLSQLLSWPF